MAKNSPDEGKNIKMVEKQAVEASMINLKEYRAKRQFGKTPEPMADTVETPNRMPVFVVQKHDASHFHFDFRLEVDGVLKSWVVPKGPSMNPKDKRLAIEVEDHPLSYAHFEGVIPEGNYGAGTVEIWDSGTYAYVGNNRNISAAIKNGILEFKLHGHKLKGLFVLIHTNMDDQDKDWLLDSYKCTLTPPKGPSGSFYAYDKTGKTAKRIDFIFVTPKIKILSYHTIDDDIKYNKYSSDHFPVMVEALLK